MAADRLALIDRELLLRIIGKNKASPPENPVLREIDTVENEIEKINSVNHPDPILALNRVNHLISARNAHVEDYENKPTRPPIEVVGVGTGGETPPPTGSGVVDDGATTGWIRKTLNAAPPRLQRVMGNLLDHIKASERLGWNQRGELLLDGQSVRGTNILDLVHAVIRPRKARAPPGTGDFIAALTEINTPIELIPNAPVLVAKARALIAAAKAGVVDPTPSTSTPATGRPSRKPTRKPKTGPKTGPKTAGGLPKTAGGHPKKPKSKHPNTLDKSVRPKYRADATSTGSSSDERAVSDTTVITPSSQVWATPEWRGRSRTPHSRDTLRGTRNRRTSSSVPRNRLTSRRPLKLLKTPTNWEKFTDK